MNEDTPIKMFGTCYLYFCDANYMYIVTDESKLGQ